MASVTIRFTDNEVLQGQAADIDLDSPDFHVDVTGDSNNEGAWVPLAAVKKITLDSGPADEHAGEANRMVAIRFADGEVLCGYLNGSLRRHRHGMTMVLYSPDRSTMDRLGVPYSAVKAIFQLRSWDSRPPGYRASREDAAPLVQLLGNARELTRLYESGAISREEYLAQRRELLDRL